MTEAEKIILEQIEKIQSCIKVVSNGNKSIVPISRFAESNSTSYGPVFICFSHLDLMLHVVDIFNTLNHSESKTFHSDKFQLIKERDQLIIVPLEEKKTSIYFEIQQQERMLLLILK